MTLPLKSMIAAGLISIAAFSPISVNAMPFDGDAGFSQEMHKGKKGKKMLKRMARYLDLTEEQVTQIKAIRTQSKADGEALRESMKAFKSEAKMLKDSEVFDEQAFNELYQKYNDTFASIALLKAKTRHEIFYVLTAEQQEKWQSFKEKRKQKRLEKRNAN